MTDNKPFNIPKKLVWNAWHRVKAKSGSPGIDGMTIEKYEEGLKENLYKLWNRMSSGTYFPKPVKQVAIPKGKGVRLLGVPTVEDRIAQVTVLLQMESELEYTFYDESYGARRDKSALQAVGECREHCWRYDYVIDLDLKSFFKQLTTNCCSKLLINTLRQSGKNSTFIVGCRHLSRRLRVKKFSLKALESRKGDQFLQRCLICSYIMVSTTG